MPPHAPLQRLALVDVLLRSPSQGPPPANAGDEAGRGRLRISQAWEHPEVLSGSRPCKKRCPQTARPHGVPRPPLSLSPSRVFLSSPCSGPPAAAFEPKYQRPRTDLGTGFKAPHSPPNPHPTIEKTLQTASLKGLGARGELLRSSRRAGRGAARPPLSAASPGPKRSRLALPSAQDGACVRPGALRGWGGRWGLFSSLFFRIPSLRMHSPPLWFKVEKEPRKG